MGTVARFESSSSQVCHLLSIPGLAGETFGEIGGETIDETILHWVFLYFSGFNKHFNKCFNRPSGHVKGLRGIKDSPLRTSSQVSRFTFLT